MVELFHTTYISVDLAHHEIFHAKVGKGCIITYIRYRFYGELCSYCKNKCLIQGVTGVVVFFVL